MCGWIMAMARAIPETASRGWSTPRDGELVGWIQR